jgi:hypothetical protein
MKTAKPPIIFIDANPYLDLYRITKGQRLIEALTEQKDFLFVTDQISREVQRRKLQVAAEFFATQFQALNVRSFEIPDHLSDLSGHAATELRSVVKDINTHVEKANEVLEEITSDALRRISRSEDEVSKALGALFDKAVKHRKEELTRARRRKEVGDPPGKKNDPLGDQLTWEQLLSHCKDRSKLWVVSKDSDYCTRRGKTIYLNPLLYAEVAQTGIDTRNVFCFDNIDDAIKHFVQHTGVKAERLPTPQESKEIKEEMKFLPPVDFAALWDDAAIAAGQQALEFQKKYAASIAAAVTAPANLQTLRTAQEEIRRVVAAVTVQANLQEEIRRAMDQQKEIRRAIEHQKDLRSRAKTIKPKTK